MNLKKQSGQIIIENILLMVVLISVFATLINYLKKQEFATQFTEAPWNTMNGMIQCGVWSPCSVEKPVNEKHPNSSHRILSLDPKTVGP